MAVGWLRADDYDLKPLNFSVAIECN